jgi:hypothetical protein
MSTLAHAPTSMTSQQKLRPLAFQVRTVLPAYPAHWLFRAAPRPRNRVMTSALGPANTISFALIGPKRSGTLPGC